MGIQDDIVTAPPPAEPTTPPRFINAVLEDRDPNTPLQVGDWCAIAFSVELSKLEIAAAAAVFKEQNLFPEGVSQIELLVQLMSDDFIVHSDPQKLIVPKTGKSKNKAKSSTIGAAKIESRQRKFTLICMG